MSITVNAFSQSEWEGHSLQDFGDFSEMVEFVNQRPDFGDCDCGDWFFIPDDPLPSGERVIYFGTFANDHSPGASQFMYAEIFDMGDEDDAALFEQRKRHWESASEYLDQCEEERLLNVEYRCPNCGHEWEEQSCCACDSECPSCGTQNISASSWEESED